MCRIPKKCRCLISSFWFHRLTQKVSPCFSSQKLSHFQVISNRFRIVSHNIDRTSPIPQRMHCLLHRIQLYPIPRVPSIDHKEDFTYDMLCFLIEMFLGFETSNYSCFFMVFFKKYTKCSDLSFLFAAVPRSLVTHYNIYMARLGRSDVNVSSFSVSFCGWENGDTTGSRNRWLSQTMLFVVMESLKRDGRLGWFLVTPRSFFRKFCLAMFVSQLVPKRS